MSKCAKKVLGGGRFDSVRGRQMRGAPPLYCGKGPMPDEKKQVIWIVTGIAVALLGVAILAGVFVRTI